MNNTNLYDNQLAESDLQRNFDKCKYSRPTCTCVTSYGGYSHFLSLKARVLD